MKFYGEQIYAPRAAEQIKIKKLLRQNCRISQRDLDSISKVIVAGKTYGGSSKLWLETSSGATRSKFLTMGNRRHAPVERLVFDLGRGESYGKTQLFIKGDIDLKRIAVVFDQTTRPRYSRDVVSPKYPKQPQEPKKSKGPKKPKGPKKSKGSKKVKKLK